MDKFAALDISLDKLLLAIEDEDYETLKGIYQASLDASDVINDDASWFDYDTPAETVNKNRRQSGAQVNLRGMIRKNVNNPHFFDSLV